MQSTVQSDLAVNVSRHFENATTLSDVIAWDSWLMELRGNPLFKASVFIVNYHSYILSAIGIPCTILSFLVLRRTKPLTSAIFIMLILSVLDTISLFVPITYRAIRSISSGSVSNAGCSLLMTTRYFLQYMPIWLVVLLTLERVVAVCFPLKAAQICTLSNARLSIVNLLILDVLICIVHTFIHEGKDTDGVTSSCYIKMQFVTFMKHWGVVDSVLFVIIPLVILCISNTAIILKLATPRQTDSATSGSSINEVNKRQNRSITVMLLSVSLTTMLCLGPNLTLISFYDTSWYSDFNVSASTYARRSLTLWIIQSLTSLNNAVNFFLYVLSGQRFRTELHDMTATWFGKHKPIVHISTVNRHP